MSPEQEQFENLRRLLALKRYEQPPPGYFHNFSREVIVRIRAGEASGDSGWEALSWEAPWLQRLWSVLDAKPVLAGAFGVAICSLLITGAIYSGRVEHPATVNLVSPSPQSTLAEQRPVVTPFLGHEPALLVSSTGGVSTAEGRISLFPDLRMERATVISFPAGN